MSREQITFPGPKEMTVTEMKVKVGSLLSQGKVILTSDWLTPAIPTSDWLIILTNDRWRSSTKRPGTRR